MYLTHWQTFPTFWNTVSPPLIARNQFFVNFVEFKQREELQTGSWTCDEFAQFLLKDNGSTLLNVVLVQNFHLPACVFFFTLHTHFSNTRIPNTPVLTTVLLRWNVSPKLPLASSVEEGNDTKYRTGGLYMIYRVTELSNTQSGSLQHYLVQNFCTLNGKHNANFWSLVLESRG